MRSHHVGRTAALLRENVKLPRPTTCAPSDAAIRRGVAAECPPGRSAFLDFEGMSHFPTAWRILHHTLITGIGRAIAELFADEGANVAICARNAEEVGNVVKALAAKGIKS